MVDDFIDPLVFGLLGKITVRRHADNICIQGHTSSLNIWSTPKWIFESQMILRKPNLEMKLDDVSPSTSKTRDPEFVAL